MGTNPYKSPARIVSAIALRPFADSECYHRPLRRGLRFTCTARKLEELKQGGYARYEGETQALAPEMNIKEDPPDEEPEKKIAKPKSKKLEKKVAKPKPKKKSKRSKK